MYFLNSALSGMRRRLVVTILTILGGTALLTASASIGMWSYWLYGQKQHLKASRSATVMIDSPENAVIEEALTKVMQVQGVESARIISVTEFRAFLKQHFPDLHDALLILGDEVIPRMMEVVFPVDLNSFSRKETVDTISALPNIARVDDGSSRLGKALNSLMWFSYGGAALAVGLWFVLFVVYLGHYQNILYTDQQEIQLIRSFGATKWAITLPWLMEGVIQSFCTGALSMLIFFTGRSYLADLYNQFFGTIGYEPFHLEFSSITLMALGMVGLAIVAHVFGGVVALLRGGIH